MDRVIPSLATAGTLMGAAITVLAQALFTPDAAGIDRLFAGGALITASFFIVRWTFRLVAETRAQSSEDREAFLARTRQDHAASLEREGMLLQQLDTQATQIAELYKQLSQERSLRQSLERAGIQDRRVQDE